MSRDTQIELRISLSQLCRPDFDQESEKSAENRKGLQVPVLLNWNLYRGDYGSTYIGGGYAFGMTEMYKGTGCTIIQLGIGIPHFDCRFYYKPEQNVLGLGMTVYL